MVFVLESLPSSGVVKGDRRQPAAPGLTAPELSFLLKTKLTDNAAGALPLECTHVHARTHSHRAGIHMNIHTWTRTNMHLQAGVHKKAQRDPFIHKHAHASRHTHRCTIQTFMKMHMHTRTVTQLLAYKMTQTHTHTHTRTHTHTQRGTDMHEHTR